MKFFDRILANIYIFFYKNNQIICMQNGIKKKKFFIKGLKVRFKGDNSTVILHEPFQFKRSKIIVRNNCTVEIAENASIRKLITTQIHNNSVLKIGKNFYCGSLKVYLHDEPDNSIIIGDNCRISTDVFLRPSDAHSIVSSQNFRLNPPQPIEIKNHVWIGMNSIVLKGSYIPENSILAAGSIYTRKSFQPGDQEERLGLDGRIFMGNPAKCVKHGDFTFC